MIDESAPRELDVGSDRTLAQQTAYIKLIPEFEMMDVVEGNKIFMADSEPTSVPSNGFFYYSRNGADMSHSPLVVS